MFHGQFFGKIVHEILHLSILYGHCPWNIALVHIIWTMSMKYGQSRKILFCPWTDDVHGQLSTKRTRPLNFEKKFRKSNISKYLFRNFEKLWPKFFTKSSKFPTLKKCIKNTRIGSSKLYFRNVRELSRMFAFLCKLVSSKIDF